MRNITCVFAFDRSLHWYNPGAMEATAQPRPDAALDRTASTGGGTSSDSLRVHAHLYRPRLKSSSVVPDFQHELRQYANKQGRSAALEYATALGEACLLQVCELLTMPVSYSNLCLKSR